MKKVLSLVLAFVLCFTLAACGGNETPAESETPTVEEGGDATAEEPVAEEPTEEPAAPAGDYSGDVTLEVMFMPNGDINPDTVAEVAEAVNARLAELGYQFKVNFSFSGVAWAWDDLNLALQTGNAPDIIPAHAWSGVVNYLTGAESGQYLRLDDPENNLLEQYGPALYSNTNPLIIEAATVPGDQGTGIYGYIIEKDFVSQLGYYVNVTALEELGFTLDDFVADDLASWEPLLQAYVDATGKYPLNIEAEVLDRTVNHIIYINSTLGPLGVQFDNANPAGTDVNIINRYQSSTYQDFIATMRGYYNAGYVDPDHGIIGEVSSSSIASRRNDGDFLISTIVYAPGNELTVARSASEVQGKDVEIAYVPGWSKPIATIESAQGSGLAVYAGTSYAPEAVTFLNLMASDEKIANYVAAGIEGKSYNIVDGIVVNTSDRGGWNVWRYGVVGVTSPAIPQDTADEWVNFKSFNASADMVSFGLFNPASVETENAACIATIDKYAIPLGSGALDPAEYDAFMEELTAVGVDAVVEAAQLQFEEFKAGMNS